LLSLLPTVVPRIVVVAHRRPLPLFSDQCTWGAMGKKKKEQKNQCQYQWQSCAGKQQRHGQPAVPWNRCLDSMSRKRSFNEGLFPSS